MPHTKKKGGGGRERGGGMLPVSNINSPFELNAKSLPGITKFFTLSNFFTYIE